MQEKKEYNIGLDIGTASVGWAVVEKETNKIYKKRKNALWGVRLFEPAVTAEGRRKFRSTRRRYDRRRKRIKLLQEEFKNEIFKIDPNFYLKLKESFYNTSDLNNKTIKITKEENSEVKKYYKNFPTIYHLRNELVNSKEKKDIRLVYLAIHHIIKYRGNFLYNNDNFNVNDLNISRKLEYLFKNIFTLCPEIDFSEENLNSIKFDYLEKALLEKSKNDKRQLLKRLEDYLPPKVSSEMIKVFLGYKFEINKLFNLELESDEEIKLSFKGSDYDDKFDDLSKILEDRIEVLNDLKELYDMLFLKELFASESIKNLSSLMVYRYNIHKNDLHFLKEIFKFDRILYNKLFRTNKEKCLYDKYVHNNINYDVFRKELDKLLKNLFDSKIDSKLLDKYSIDVKLRIENGDFLPRITDSDNGKFPFQLNKDELIKIIENQGKYYPFLLNMIDNGEKYKLVRLLEFRIPYYVGPLNNQTANKDIKNPNAWLIRKNENVNITPYNFEEVINKDATAEEFIVRMISNCTYLLNEKAIPANSILYSKYKVLNELKQIKINGNKITNGLQHKIYEEVFKKTTGTITEKKLKEFLKASGEVDMYEELDITGFSSNNKFANNMQSYIDFYGGNGFFENNTYSEDDAEEIIKWVTIFEDKEILENKIRKTYTKLPDNTIKRIVNKRYTGWSSLSKKLLKEIYYHNNKTDEHKSIIDLLWETEDNFMQIISSKKYNFQKLFDNDNKIEKKDKINYDLVAELATSPATKRGIYQALKIVEEIIDYLGYEPNKILIEMARGEEEKKRKDTRKDYLSRIYQLNKSNIDDYKRLFNELNNIDIFTQKLFLYFIQEGKSLYSGTPLNINNLEEYEIDHIIPQTLIKDDSIDNKALVLRSENQEKAASFVLPSRFRNNQMYAFWNHLKKINLISPKKHYNLTRKEYSKEDIEGFINRQLVETRQITKHVANILSNYYENTQIIYLSANYAHNYREKFELFKFRDLNDFHHAHDAYLTAVLGEYKEKYIHDIDFEKIKEMNSLMYQEKKWKDLRYGYVVNSLDNFFLHIDDETGEVKFNIEEFNITVEDTLYRNDILITKKTEIRTGEFYNQTKNNKNFKGKNVVNIKDNLPNDIYGSYSSLNPAYAIVIQYIKKNKEYQRMIGIPIHVGLKMKKYPFVLNEYICKLLNLEKQEIKIIKNRIPFHSVFNWDGQICSLVGASDTIEVCNAKEFIIDKNNMKRWKNTLNRLLNKKKYFEDNDIIYENHLNETMSYIIRKIEKEYCLYKNLIDTMREMFKIDNLNSISIENKEKIIIEVLKLLKFNSKNANMKFLDQKYSLAFGKKNDRIIEHSKIIDYSITGLRKKENEF